MGRSTTVGTPHMTKFLNLFARFVMENDIAAQYSTPSEPQQNGVAERRNRTLMDMVRSMNYGQKDYPRLIIFVCGAVQLRLRYLIQTLGN